MIVDQQRNFDLVRRVFNVAIASETRASLII